MKANPIYDRANSLEGESVMQLEIRKRAEYVEEILSEGGREVDPPLRLAAAMAVIRNPYAGRPFVEDLQPMIKAFSPVLGEMLGRRAVELAGGEVESFGKGALVGSAGEIEHGSAIIHTLQFGNPFRDAAGATSLLPSAEKRGGVGATLDLAMKHIHDHGVRSHHMTFEVRIPDAPAPDEIVVVCAASSGGRPHARIGDLKDEL